MRNLLVAIACLSLAGCGEIGKPAVVSIGKESLTLEDLRRTYADLPPSARPSLATRPQRVAFVDEVVRRRLLVLHGQSLADADSTDPVAVREREDILLRRLQATEGGMADPTDAELEEAGARFATRFRVRRIVCVTREDAARAADLLSRGEPPSSIAAGATVLVLPVETWTWFPWPIDPLSDALLALEPGGVTAPIEGDGFVQVAQVLERTAPLPDAEPAPNTRLAEAVRRQKRERAVLALERALREKSQARIDPAALKLLVDRTRASVLEGHRVETDLDFALPSLSPEEKSLAIATYRSPSGSEERLLVGDYSSALERLSPARRPWRGSIDTVVRRMVDQEIGRRLLVREAERRGITEDWWAERDLRLLEEERVLRRGRRAIESSATLSDASIDSMTTLMLLAQPSILHQPARARVVRADFPSVESALQERERARTAGGLLRRFADVLEGRALSPGTYHVFRVSAGGMGSVAIDQLVFSSKPGTIEGPVQFGASWILLEVQGFESPVERPVEAVRAEIQRNLRDSRSAPAVEEWVRARREELGVRVDGELLDRLSPGV